uniref:Uncharacterized protein n=1 Tax=Plectus sambesii TaxID=2011161 RepID=A0A914W250_9BILA
MPTAANDGRRTDRARTHRDIGGADALRGPIKRSFAPDWRRNFSSRSPGRLAQPVSAASVRAETGGWRLIARRRLAGAAGTDGAGNRPLISAIERQRRRPAGRPAIGAANRSERPASQVSVCLPKSGRILSPACPSDPHPIPIRRRPSSHSLRNRQSLLPDDGAAREPITLRAAGRPTGGRPRLSLSRQLGRRSSPPKKKAPPSLRSVRYASDCVAQKAPALQSSSEWGRADNRAHSEYGSRDLTRRAPTISAA